MGNTITDKDGIFAYIWKGIHSEIGHSEPHGGSFWFPVAYYDGNKNYFSTAKNGEQFIVKDLEPSQKTFIAEAAETKPAKSYDDGKIWLEQNEFTLPLQGHIPATLHGEVEDGHDGEKVKIKVQFPDNNVYVYEKTIKDGKFSLEYNFGPDNLAGTYHITIEHDGGPISKMIQFSPVTFKMIKNISNSEKTFIAEAAESSGAISKENKLAEKNKNEILKRLEQAKDFVGYKKSHIHTLDYAESFKAYELKNEAWEKHGGAVGYVTRAQENYDYALNFLKTNDYEEANLKFSYANSDIDNVYVYLEQTDHLIQKAESLEKKYQLNKPEVQQKNVNNSDMGKEKTCIWFICW